MDDEFKPSAPAVDHGLQNRLEKSPRKSGFYSVYCRKTPWATKHSSASA